MHYCTSEIENGLYTDYFKILISKVNTKMLNKSVSF